MTPQAAAEARCRRAVARGARVARLHNGPAVHYDARVDTLTAAQARPTRAHAPPAAPPRVRMLSMHASYACGNTGRCCSAGWPIPVEAHVLPVLKTAIADGTVREVDGSAPLVFPAERPEWAGAVLGHAASGACVFFDPQQPGGHCRVQRHAGTPAMPVACRQFPRIARHDATGTAVTLSHWCPTAVTLLDADRPVTVVEAPVAFSDAPAYEGLDARDAWPPLLRPDCLFDLEAYACFEACGVQLLTHPGDSLMARLTRLSNWVEQVRRWRPGSGDLEPWIRSAADAALHQDVDAEALREANDRRAAWAHLWRDVLDAIPPTLLLHVPERLRASSAGETPCASAGETPCADEAEGDPRLGRYLAARLFGSWVAYQGTGVRSVLASVHAAAAVLQRALRAGETATADTRVREAIRTADLLLVHLARPEVLARHYNKWELRPPAFIVNAGHAGQA